ncbi:desiccation-related protein PCC13-62 [Manihot esculenta]|uniref:Desiccation-related protein PCC13-62 n=1 Tax=Manihot esculenta TaxID=3983 RepID=A0A2C9UBU7_MANES|nr:desiccation-related protein PCC13-62 [Manihot esculenta]
MALSTCTTIAPIVAYLVLLLTPISYSSPLVIRNVVDDERISSSISEKDIDLLEFPLNLEYLGAEFFLHASTGHGLERYAPNLASGGPRPLGAKKAKLDPLIRDVIEQFAWQDVGHLRAIKQTVEGFPRPLLDLRAESFAKVMDKAFGRSLSPPFDPYASGINFLIASYMIPYVGLTGYIGTNQRLKGSASKQLVAGLLSVKSGQDAVIRGLLYERALEKVQPYGITVAEFTDRLSDLRNKLGDRGLKDEGLIVPKYKGAEGKIRGNVLAGNQDSVGFARSPREILRIVYGGGNEHSAGGFFPHGANGRIARSYLR